MAERELGNSWGGRRRLRRIMKVSKGFTPGRAIHEAFDALVATIILAASRRDGLLDAIRKRNGSTMKCTRCPRQRKDLRVLRRMRANDGAKRG